MGLSRLTVPPPHAPSVALSERPTKRKNLIIVKQYILEDIDDPEPVAAVPERAGNWH